MHIYFFRLFSIIGNCKILNTVKGRTFCEAIVQKAQLRFPEFSSILKTGSYQDQLSSCDHVHSKPETRQKGHGQSQENLCPNALTLSRCFLLGKAWLRECQVCSRTQRNRKLYILGHFKHGSLLETNWLWLQEVFFFFFKLLQCTYPVQRPLRFLRNCDRGSDFQVGQIIAFIHQHLLRRNFTCVLIQQVGRPRHYYHITLTLSCNTLIHIPGPTHSESEFRTR